MRFQVYDWPGIKLLLSIESTVKLSRWAKQIPVKKKFITKKIQQKVKNVDVYFLFNIMRRLQNTTSRQQTKMRSKDDTITRRLGVYLLLIDFLSPTRSSAQFSENVRRHGFTIFGISCVCRNDCFWGCNLFIIII